MTASEYAVEPRASAEMATEDTKLFSEDVETGDELQLTKEEMQGAAALEGTLERCICGSSEPLIDDGDSWPYCPECGMV